MKTVGKRSFLNMTRDPMAFTGKDMRSTHDIGGVSIMLRKGGTTSSKGLPFILLLYPFHVFPL